MILFYLSLQTHLKLYLPENNLKEFCEKHHKIEL